MPDYVTRLQGGHPNSLGDTIAVVEEVLAHPDYFPDLFACYFSDDEVVRLRTSNAMKRIAKANPALLLPYLDRFLTEIAAIDQASTQWTLAQLFQIYEKELKPEQRERATALLKHNLAHHTDWIVLNTTMETLGRWARQEPELRAWLRPHLERLAGDGRKSVEKKARGWLGSNP